MASFSTRKLCSTTSGCKQTSATNCEGCGQAYCTKHFIDHRLVLAEEVNTIIHDHNHLQETFNQQSTDLESHVFIKTIDEWEKQSIAKIQQKAKDLRFELFQLATTRKNELSKKLQQFSEQLNEGRQNDNFIETDLQQWKITLENLKGNFDSSSTFSLDLNEDFPLVQNTSVILTIENELFEHVFDDIAQIKENGQIVIHDTSNNYTEIRGKNEYLSGRHKIRLFIEQSTDSWTYLGINSKSMLLQKQSCSSKSSYGWTNNNYYWLNGECHPNRSTSRIEMKTNDIISLIFDCDHRKILMTNERTNAKFELDVNIDFCPLPWRLHVNLYEANSRVRILSA